MQHDLLIGIHGDEQGRRQQHDHVMRILCRGQAKDQHHHDEQAEPPPVAPQLLYESALATLVLEEARNNLTTIEVGTYSGNEAEHCQATINPFSTTKEVFTGFRHRFKSKEAL